MKVLQHTAVRLTIQEQLYGIRLLQGATLCTGIFMFFLFEPPVDWIGAFCIALGSLFGVLAPTETLTFDKHQKFLIIDQNRLIQRKITRHPLEEIETAEVNPVDWLGTRFYRINLNMISGQRLAVTHTVSTDWQQQQKIVRHIRGFLNPSQQSGSSKTTSTVNTTL